MSEMPPVVMEPVLVTPPEKLVLVTVIQAVVPLLV